MSASSTTKMKAVFGAMTIGKPGVEMARVHTLEETMSMLELFHKFGYDTVDTARVYGEGSSEEYLGNLSLKDKGFKIDTKLYPTAIRPALSKEHYHHSKEDLRTGLMRSLKALKVDKVNTWYLHGPDRTVAFEETLREVNNLHKEGLFEQWGFSNYQAWEVAKMCEICEKNGWVKPAVCQGLYNAFHRAVEMELFPVLRHYGIAFYCFNPLAGGFLTGKYKRDQHEFEAGSRFDPNRNQGKLHQSRYFDSYYFDALETLQPVARKAGITEIQCAMRWLCHHSAMKAELGDAIVLGASSVKQLEQNLEAVQQGPLPADVVQALDEGYRKIRGKELRYWH